MADDLDGHAEGQVSDTNRAVLEADCGVENALYSSAALPMLPMLPWRHLTLAQSSHHLSRLRQSNGPAANTMTIRPAHAHYTQSSGHSTQTITRRVSPVADNVFPNKGISSTLSRPRPGQEISAISALLKPRLSQQKHAALCVKAKLSKVLPSPFDTQVASDIESRVRKEVQELSERKACATRYSRHSSAMLPVDLTPLVPEQRMAKALLKLVDLPMISMPCIKPSGLPRPDQPFNDKMDMQAQCCTLLNPLTQFTMEARQAPGASRAQPIIQHM